MAKHKPPPWLQPKPQHDAVKVGVAWYAPEQWALVKSAAADAERFEETYADWVAMAEDATRGLFAAGVITERVPITASDLLAWCLAHGKESNAAARAEFVTHIQSRRHESDV